MTKGDVAARRSLWLRILNSRDLYSLFWCVPTHPTADNDSTVFTATMARASSSSFKEPQKPLAILHVVYLTRNVSDEVHTPSGQRNDLARLLFLHTTQPKNCKIWVWVFLIDTQYTRCTTYDVYRTVRRMSVPCEKKVVKFEKRDQEWDDRQTHGSEPLYSAILVCFFFNVNWVVISFSYFVVDELRK